MNVGKENDSRAGGWPVWGLVYLACTAAAALLIMGLGHRWKPSDEVPESRGERGPSVELPPVESPIQKKADLV